MTGPTSPPDDSRSNESTIEKNRAADPVSEAFGIVAAQIDAAYTENPTWYQFTLAFRSTAEPDDAIGDPLATPPPEEPDETAASAEPNAEKLVRQAALLAFSYVVSFVDEKDRPKLVFGPFSSFNNEIWPHPPHKIPDEIAARWPRLAAEVTGSAPRARLRAASFLRGGKGQAQHGRDAATAYLDAANEAGRRPEIVEYLRSALRIGRAIRDATIVDTALDKLLVFVATEMESTDAGLGFAVQALEVAAAEPSCPARVDELAEQLSKRARYLPIADRGLQVLLKRAAPADKAAVWGRRIDLQRAEAMAADLSAVKVFKLQQALGLAEKAGDPTRREQLASDLQAAAQEDLGMLHLSATSHQYEEEVANQIDAMIGHANWARAIQSFATFGPVTGSPERNREVIEARLGASVLHRLMPTQLLGPDGLPSYTGISEEDRFEVELVRWEAELLTNWARLLAHGLHKIPERFGTPSGQELFKFLNTWPGFNVATVQVLAVALMRYWAGDSDATTYTALPQLEGSIRSLVRAQGRGVYRIQKQHKPGQTLGLGALLPILAETHQISDAWIRAYNAALVHPAGLNLRNHLMHGFGGLTGPDTAAIVLYLLLHLGTLEARRDDPVS